MNALFLTPTVNNWLANSSRPRILHVFEQACNLINERGEVLSIVTPEIGNGPFNLVIDEPIVFSKYLDVESQIAFDINRLKLGEITIDTESATLWSACPDWKMLHTDKDKILGQLRSLSPANYHPLLPNALIVNLFSALARADISTALRLAPKLAGLGAGLTPAGDDFILGAILAVWVIHSQEIAKLIAEEITNTAAPLTTSLSAAWLRSAGRGEAGILWHQFFDVLISSNNLRIEEAINNILAVGETSGADALAGFNGVILYSVSI